MSSRGPVMIHTPGVTQLHRWVTNQTAVPKPPVTTAPRAGTAVVVTGGCVVDVSLRTSDDGVNAAWAGFVSRPASVYATFHRDVVGGAVKAQVPGTGSAMTVTCVVAVYGPGSLPVPVSSSVSLDDPIL